MQSGPPSADESQLPGIPTQRTLSLVNTYLVHSTRLLNEFAASADCRLQDTRSRINHLDAKLQLLEAKVDSAYSSGEASSTADEGPSANGGKGSHSQPSKVEGPESIAPSVRDGSEVDQYDVDDLQLRHIPSGSPPG